MASPTRNLTNPSGVSRMAPADVPTPTIAIPSLFSRCIAVLTPRIPPMVQRGCTFPSVPVPVIKIPPPPLARLIFNTFPAVYRDGNTASATGQLYPPPCRLKATGGTADPSTPTTLTQPVAQFVSTPPKITFAANGAVCQIPVAFQISHPNTVDPIPVDAIVCRVTGGTASPLVADGAGGYSCTITAQSAVGTTSQLSVVIQATDQAGKISTALNWNMAVKGINTNGPANYLGGMPVDSTVTTANRPYLMGNSPATVTVQGGQTLQLAGGILPSRADDPDVFGKSLAVEWLVDGTAYPVSVHQSVYGGTGNAYVNSSWWIGACKLPILAAGSHTLAQRVTIDNCIASTSASCPLVVLPNSYPDPTLGGMSVAAYPGQHSVLRLANLVTANDLTSLKLEIPSVPNFGYTFDPEGSYPCGGNRVWGTDGATITGRGAEPITAVGTARIDPIVVTAGDYPSLDLGTYILDNARVQGSHSVTVTGTDAAGKTFTHTESVTFPAPTLDGSRFALMPIVGAGLHTLTYGSAEESVLIGDHWYGHYETRTIARTSRIRLQAASRSRHILYFPDGWPKGITNSTTDFSPGVGIDFPAASGWCQHDGYSAYFKRAFGDRTIVLDLSTTDLVTDSVGLTVDAMDGALAGKTIQFGHWKADDAACPQAAFLFPHIGIVANTDATIESMRPESQSHISMVEILSGSTVIGRATPVNGALNLNTYGPSSLFGVDPTPNDTPATGTPWLAQTSPDITRYEIHSNCTEWLPAALDTADSGERLAYRVTCADGSTTQQAPTETFGHHPFTRLEVGGKTDQQATAGLSASLVTCPAVAAAPTTTPLAVDTVDVTTASGTISCLRISVSKAQMARALTPDNPTYWPKVEITWPAIFSGFGDFKLVNVVPLTGGAEPCFRSKDGYWHQRTGGMFPVQTDFCSAVPGRYFMRARQMDSSMTMAYANLVIDVTE